MGNKLKSMFLTLTMVMFLCVVMSISVSAETQTNYLTFTANTAGSTVSPCFASGEYWYSTDDGVTWTKGVNNDGDGGPITTITLQNAGDTVMLKGNNCISFNDDFYTCSFKMTGSIAASGSVTSLTDCSGVNPDVTLAEKCYMGMFEDCEALKTAPELPAKTLAKNCYAMMFYGTGLTQAPELPATTLAEQCYQSMFNGCEELTTVPDLPAEELAVYCYDNMFAGCTALVNAPKILATKLANSCCYNMFYGCTALKNAPELPVETLAEGCYYTMFRGCSSLTDAPTLPATKLVAECYQGMFKDCETLVNAPALPAKELADSCYYNMFENCKALTNAPDLPATELADRCYFNMFCNCTSLTAMPLMGGGAAISLDEKKCCKYMFDGCTSLLVYNTPANGRELKLDCKLVSGTDITENMFSNCSTEGDYCNGKTESPTDEFECYCNISVCKIGKTKYESVQAAINAAGTTPTKIKMIADSKENVTIASNSNITLDMTEGALKGKINVEIGATLNIKNSSIETEDINNAGTITFDMTDATATNIRLIDYTGTGTATYGTAGTNYKFASGKDNGYVLKVEGNDLYAAKIPVVADFTFTAPTNLTADGNPKEATVATNSNITGMGAITVYYSSDSGATWSTSAPTAVGTYTVKIDVAEGTEYASATDLTDSTWTFTITEAAPTPTPTPVPSPSNEITIPVSGDKNEVPVKAEIKDNNAVIETVTKEEIAQVGTEEIVKIDVSEVEINGKVQQISEVTLTKETLQNINDSDASGLEVNLSTADVIIDQNTLKAVIEQAEGDEIHLVVDKDENAEKTLTDAQKETIEEMNQPVVLDAYFVSSGKRISDFQGGKVKIRAEYATDKPVRVWFVSDDGDKERVKSSFDPEKNVASFDVEHFSHYVIESIDEAPYVVAKTIASGKNALKVSWNKCEGASSYAIYANKCNTKSKKYSVKKIATTKGTSYTIKKLSGKKLAKNTFYKVKVVALDANGNKLATSKVMHAATGGYSGKYGNTTKITAKKSELAVSVGDTKTVGVKTYKIYKNKKVPTTHAAKVRYMSSNKNVATVNSKGVVTGIKSGSCTIYMQAPNGLWATTEVIVLQNTGAIVR